MVKDTSLRYVWVNAAFETLFDVRREELLGRLDAEAFPNRQAVACSGGDTRVLESGEINEAYETVYRNKIEPRVNAAIRHFVHVAESCLREVDLIARIGGEEFVILLPGIGHEDALGIAERIRTTLGHTPLDYDGTSIPFTVSIGITYSDGRFDLETNLKVADKGLYAAKSTGRNRVVELA